MSHNRACIKHNLILMVNPNCLLHQLIGPLQFAIACKNQRIAGDGASIFWCDFQRFFKDLDHGQVGIITIHGDHLAAAPGGNTVVQSLSIEPV